MGYHDKTIEDGKRRVADFLEVAAARKRRGEFDEPWGDPQRKESLAALQGLVQPLRFVDLEDIRRIVVSGAEEHWLGEVARIVADLEFAGQQAIDVAAAGLALYRSRPKAAEG